MEDVAPAFACWSGRGLLFLPVLFSEDNCTARHSSGSDFRAVTIFGEFDSTHMLDPQSDSHQLSARYGQLGEKSLHRVGQTLLRQGVPTAAPVAIQTYSLNSWT